MLVLKPSIHGTKSSMPKNARANRKVFVTSYRNVTAIKDVCCIVYWHIGKFVSVTKVFNYEGMQIIIRHSNLNSYLHRRKQRDTINCPVHHIALTCSCITVEISILFGCLWNICKNSSKANSYLNVIWL